ncbi:RloB domain-containing protein [Clostridium saudiense]|uniref:RloB domain-containing protein n=1 Tax=Clostridium saudiense TaxID=1414720 RepID=UPI0018AC7A19|nr:RloB domain-containing protein [Clostridium saudiense]
MIRYTKPKARLFVEGNTEYNYFKELGKDIDIDFAIEPIDMRGGGYKNFLLQIKKKGFLGCTIIFVIIDLDKVCEDKDNFDNLIKYCNNQNKRTSVPYFVIGSFKDFEYFACLHSKEYKNGDTTNFILKNYKYRNLDEFKSDTKIFNFLNSNGKSKEIAIEKLNKKQAYIKNEYRPVNKSSGDITIKPIKIHIDKNLEHVKNSNMNEFFEVIGQAIKK